MTKSQSLYQSLVKAHKKLEEARSFPDTEPMREAAIQRYEYTFELAWKLMQSILKDQLVESYGVKNILRNAYKLDLIDDLDSWFNYALARNKAAHIYKESVADEVYRVAVGSFPQAVTQLLKRAKRYLE